MKMILRKSIDECQMRIKLLDSLQQLRSVRLTQAKQQGGLFPHQVDEKFNFDISELKDLLLGQAAKLESSYAKVKDILRYRENLQSKHNYNAISQTQSSCCIHVPNLSKSLQIKLFGNHCTTKLSDIPQRWQRFYHQADYNFCDFIRIRYAWDKYLKTDISLSDQLDNYELPRHWILPEMDRNEQKEKEKEATHNKDTTTNCTEKGVSNVHDKWVRYLRVIPVSICSTSCSSSDFVPS
ncbi:unnamed protein product [Heterobilharzia americana]|nr:unnamed protein product [Heterobilharzia americana]